MIFSSWGFLVLFLPITWATYFVSLKISNINITKIIIIFSSLVFYSIWNVNYLPIITGSILVNYWIGIRLSNNKSKALLAVAILANLIPLVFFKYMGWLTSDNWLLSIALPLGISFYTFQQIGYQVDCYQKKVKEHGFLNYASFVSFFPQLIAGPIVHHKELTAQFNTLSSKTITADKVGLGLILFITGLFKKVVIADNLAPYANVVFDNATELTMIDAWTGALAYTLQLYFDFSGYCEMAMGIALLFGIALPVNFSSPYKARNIAVFWRTWHITLGAFFRQYIYIPLGGNQTKFLTNILILFVVATISGIWHGAGSTFLIWGMLHGLALIIHRVWSKIDIEMPKIMAVFITFIFVLITWVPFRSDNLDMTIAVWKSMLDISNIGLPSLVGKEFEQFTHSIIFYGHEILACLMMLFMVWYYPNIHEIKKHSSSISAIKYSMILGISLFSLGQSNEFLYFDF
jgi:alginate O-acetyltransferase complex protein AlgI